MARSNGNGWARAAAALTSVTHKRAPLVRWGTIAVLVAIWIWSGVTGWYHAPDGAGMGGAEAAYRTISALAPDGSYLSPPNWQLNLARFAGLAVPLAGLALAFSAQLGRSLSQLLNLGAANHVVIAGGQPAAVSLAFDCVKAGDVVLLIAPALMDETETQLQSRGVTVVRGDAMRPEVLRTARAHKAAHVVAFDADDARNLQIEAAMRALTAKKRRRRPIAVHVATASLPLLQEAREMRSRAQRRLEKAAKDAGGRPKSDAVDTRPFSLDELAARKLLQSAAPEWLSVARALNQDRVHLVFFGFEGAAEAVCVRALTTMWSAEFEAPRITVLTQDPRTAELRFRARYPQATAHPHLWAADIDFRAFDWTLAAVDQSVLEAIERERGRGTAVVIATGSDATNISVALSVLRACERGGCWPVPIYLHETAESEFSRQYAAGDDTPDELDAYLEAFGAHEKIATHAILIEGEIDRGAALAHAFYDADLSAKSGVSLRELQAAAKDWDSVLETYRNANRAAADSALVKLWDLGWRPAGQGVRGERSPAIEDAAVARLARREHDRWMAERLVAGWRPGATRDNDLLIHPNLKPWEGLSPEEQSRDAVQVRAAIDVARAAYPAGFTPRA